MRTDFAFGASELRAEELSLEEARLLKRKSIDPLNANEQDKSRQAHFYAFMRLFDCFSLMAIDLKFYLCVEYVISLDVYFIYFLGGNK